MFDWFPFISSGSVLQILDRLLRTDFKSVPRGVSEVNIRSN